MSVKIDQALLSSAIAGGFALDLVLSDEEYAVWNGASYDFKTGVYTPTQSRPYVAVDIFPAGKSSFSLAHTDEEVGLIQFLVNHPIRNGSIVAKAKVGAMEAVFKIGSNHSYDGQVVEIDRNSRSAGTYENGFYQIMFRAYYRAFVSR